MAELCLDCWNKLTNSQYRPQCFLLSKELDLCEECGEWKPVIVRFKRRYIKFIRPKQASKASADPDDYDFADEEEYINEDEPEQEEETEDMK